MKRHGNLWNKITDPDNLYRAYKRARHGKSTRRAVKQFEFDIAGNLLLLQRLLCTGTFRTSVYKTKTIYEPKQREIYILPFFPDRIVQHALLQVLIPIWDRLMIHDSYACREGKGMHDASRKTMDHVRTYKYCLKCDISKFYPSIDHDILMAIIRRKIKCGPTLALLENIVRSFDGGKNTPIGNYTSQWFGNLYMNELDQAVKHEHKMHAYIRYCDDFVIFDNCKKKLQDLQKWIGEFLANKLMLKFSKASVFPVTQGVDFLGYRHFPQKILLRKETAKRVTRRLRSLPFLMQVGKITIEQYRSSIASTEGWLRWASTYNLRLKLNLAFLKGALA
jgi:retron-type reverse transcriptase